MPAESIPIEQVYSIVDFLSADTITYKSIMIKVKPSQVPHQIDLGLMRLSRFIDMNAPIGELVYVIKEGKISEAKQLLIDFNWKELN
jgi:hypothetical protein